MKKVLKTIQMVCDWPLILPTILIYKNETISSTLRLQKSYQLMCMMIPKLWILPEKLNTIFYSPDSYIHLNVMALLRLCKNIALKIDP